MFPSIFLLFSAGFDGIAVISCKLQVIATFRTVMKARVVLNQSQLVADRHGSQRLNIGPNLGSLEHTEGIEENTSKGGVCINQPEQQRSVRMPCQQLERKPEL